MSSEVLKTADGDVWYAEAVDWNSADPHAVLRIGVSKKAIANRAGRGQTWALGQMYGVLATGLISFQHVFIGLRRPMYVNGDKHAEVGKYVFTWKAMWDARMTPDGKSFERRAAPVERVFFVHVTPNVDLANYPDIFGWAEHWGWLKEHESLTGAPIDYKTRYDNRLWSR